MGSPRNESSAKAEADHFRVSAAPRDRIKLPGVFWAALKAIGLSPGAILQRSNLPPTAYSGESLVTTAQNFAIWRAIRELSNDATLGWKAMSLVETDQYHPTLLAALPPAPIGKLTTTAQRFLAVQSRSQGGQLLRRHQTSPRDQSAVSRRLGRSRTVNTTKLKDLKPDAVRTAMIIARAKERREEIVVVFQLPGCTSVTSD